MLHAPMAKVTTKSRVKFPGIVEDARKLRVHRATLFRTLNGEWNLPGLRSRYEKLKAEQRAASARAA